VATNIRLVPDEQAWHGLCSRMRPLIVDVPTDATLTVGDFISRVGAAAMPVGAKDFTVAILDKSSPQKRRVLDSGEVLSKALAGRAGTVEVICLPPPGAVCAGSQSKSEAASAVDTTLLHAKAGQRRMADKYCPDEMLRELAALPVPTYASPAGLVPVDDGADWVREVLSCASGIQRASKGRGHLSDRIFYQSSEFCALYVGHPKSTVHLLVTPTRLLRRKDVSASSAALVRRMAHFARHLSESLSSLHPDLRFQHGLRLREGRVQQLHAHILSLDLRAPRLDFVSRRHFEDFTGGEDCIMSLDAAAARLEAGCSLPSGGGMMSCDQRPLSTELSCHRCGHLFGNAFMQLLQHLQRCDAWPPGQSEKCAPAAAVPADSASAGPGARELAQLEEMGFLAFGRDALWRALVTGGSVERAVAMLAES